ncbi:MAG TPA: hypothetical protein VGR28_14385 [Candidatus Thermoplasmatota archaeon]|jgi:hypothetical protein|nr:hypothetical protein [Candidatus Thermoplasmatota archaeon]
MAKGPATVVLAAVALAGCLGAAPAPQDLGATAPAPVVAVPADHGLRLDAQDCTEGGGYSTYNKADLEGLLPAPWVLADVSADLGDPLVLGLAEGPNMGGGIAGIYHATWQCATHTMDGEDGGAILGGFVGLRVEPPPFDSGGAARHYFVTVLSSGDHHLLEHLEQNGFAHVGDAQGVVEWLGPVFHQVLDDAMHGRYEVHFVAHEAGPKDDGVTRLWMLFEGDDADYHPRSLDLLDTGGVHYYAEQGNGPFTHTNTDDHAPLPAAAGNVAGLAFEGFARTVTVGPAPPVALDQTFEHL